MLEPQDKKQRKIRIGFSCKQTTRNGDGITR